MRSKIVTAPTKEPISLAELKLFLRIDDTSEDTLLTSYIQMAREKLEKLTNRSFITQTWRLVLDFLPVTSKNDTWWDGERHGAINQIFGDPKYIQLPIGPVQSITSVKYFSTDNSENTYAATNYFLDDSGDVNRIVRNDNSVWPSALRTYASVHIDYLTGYGDNASEVPSSIQTSIKLLASHYYENRGECSDSEIPSSVMTLISCFSVKRLG